MAAVLVAACGTVDLGPRYSPPPIRMPEPLPATPAAPAPAPQPMGAQPMPVPAPPPSAPQPLPPVAAPGPEANPNLVTLTTTMDGASVIDRVQHALHGQPRDLLGDGMPFGLVGIEHGRIGPAFEHVRHQPGDVHAVRDAGVHAVACKGHPQVRCIAGQEDAAVPQA